jgi:hypothetical protein
MGGSYAKAEGGVQSPKGGVTCWIRILELTPVILGLRNVRLGFLARLG